MTTNIEPTIGYSTSHHLLLDLDLCDTYKATHLAVMIMKEHPKVGDCLTVLSSEYHNRYGQPLQNWHLIFDNTLYWREIIYIVETLAYLGVLNKDYLWIRRFRGDMTLRISPKKSEVRLHPTPEPQTYIYNNNVSNSDGGIYQYLKALKTFHPQPYNLKYTALLHFLTKPRFIPKTVKN